MHVQCEVPDQHPVTVVVIAVVVAVVIPVAHSLVTRTPTPPLKPDYIRIKSQACHSLAL